MLTVKIVLCSWCKKDVPTLIEADGLERIPPGIHEAKLSISHGICKSCEVNLEPRKSEGGVTPKDTSQDRIQEMKEFFEGKPLVTLDDIKVLMTRAGDMRWPDDDHQCRLQRCQANGHIHPHFKSSEGKSMLRALYGIESSKELLKSQADDLYEKFGKVLSGLAFLSRDRDGTPCITLPLGETEEEIKASVLKYDVGPGVGDSV